MKKELSPAATWTIVGIAVVAVVGGGLYYVNASTSFSGSKKGRPPAPYVSSPSGPPPAPPGG